jgi:hypothetical protein
MGNLIHLGPYPGDFRISLRINVFLCEGFVLLDWLGYPQQCPEGLENPVQIQTHMIPSQTRKPYLFLSAHIVA